MSVRAVTPRIPALHGLVHRHDCAGDCCNYDAAQDLRVTGEDIFSSEWPDKPLRTKPTARPRNERPTPSASSASLIHASGDREGGRYARTPEAQSSPAAPADCQGSNATGGPALLLPAGSPTPLEAAKRPGGHRDAS